MQGFEQNYSKRFQTLVIMIGIQGSGKSTFCREMLSDEFVRINLDTLKTRYREQALLAESIAAGKSIVIDNTNPTRADRARYIAAAKGNGYRVIGYFMQSILQDCIARNERRKGKAKVPVIAIAATSNKLEMPSVREGFDELYFVANDGKTMTVSEWRETNEL